MRVLEVEVEVAGLDRVDGDAPGLLVFHAGFESLFSSPHQASLASNSSMRDRGRLHGLRRQLQILVEIALFEQSVAVRWIPMHWDFATLQERPFKDKLFEKGAMVVAWEETP